MKDRGKIGKEREVYSYWRLNKRKKYGEHFALVSPSNSCLEYKYSTVPFSLVHNYTNTKFRKKINNNCLLKFDKKTSNN